MKNKINVIKAKDEYAKYCGALDWYDHINGMSARDVEIEMEYVCEYLTNPMIEMLQTLSNLMKEDVFLHDTSIKQWFSNTVIEVDELIKQATEL